MWFKKKIDPKKIKRKNTKALQANGVEVIDHLPILEIPSFRDSEEVAKRMMVLLALFQLHLQAPEHVIEDWLSENDLFDSMTEEEKRFLEMSYNELPERDQINIYWFVEALWAFAWAGGLHDNLSLNTGVGSSLASFLPNIAHGESALPFIKTYKLRDKLELFTELDKFYRGHWFARNNQLTGRTSTKTNIDLIMERRKALEFCCCSDVSWDDIDLST